MQIRLLLDANQSREFIEQILITAKKSNRSFYRITGIWDFGIDLIEIERNGNVKFTIRNFFM